MFSRTVLSEYSNLLLTIYRHAQELPIQEFQNTILSAIKLHLPFNSSMWGTATMTDGGIDIHTVHLHNSSQQMLLAYDKVKHLDLAAQQVSAVPTSTIAFDSVTDFPKDEQLEYRKFLADFGHRHMLITSDINPITRFAQWVSLYRSDEGQPCTDDECQLLAYLAPHLMQALAINRLVHLDRLNSDVAREQWSVAIADTRGVLYHADRRFKELLDQEWAIKNNDRLPENLMQEMMGGQGQAIGAKIIVKCSAEQGLLFLKARPKLAVDNLSAREFLVAKLMASGLTQKQAALKLERSPDTVRSQIKTVFDKLNINNITLLAPLLAMRD